MISPDTVCGCGLDHGHSAIEAAAGLPSWLWAGLPASAARQGGLTAGVLTGWAQLLLGVAAVIGAIIGPVIGLFVHSKVSQVKVMVNGRLDSLLKQNAELEDRNDQLSRAADTTQQEG